MITWCQPIFKHKAPILTFKNTKAMENKHLGNRSGLNGIKEP